MARSLAAVAANYDMGASMAPEAIAWMSLVQTVAIVYGPRLFAVRARRAKPSTIDNDPHQFAGAYPQ